MTFLYGFSRKSSTIYDCFGILSEKKKNKNKKKKNKQTNLCNNKVFNPKFFHLLMRVSNGGGMDLFPLLPSSFFLSFFLFFFSFLFFFFFLMSSSLLFF
jgi:hypothetical protein